MTIAFTRFKYKKGVTLTPRIVLKVNDLPQANRYHTVTMTLRELNLSGNNFVKNVQFERCNLHKRVYIQLVVYLPRRSRVLVIPGHLSNL